MQNKRDLVIHSIDLSGFGKNQYGDPIWRIVRADTRFDLLIYQGKRFYMPRYNCGTAWVLEKYLPCSEDIGLSREQWDAMFATRMLGQAQPEYPAQGDYEESFIFDGNVDTVTAYHRIAAIEFDQNNFTDADRTKAMMAAEEAKHRAQDEAKIERILVAMDKPAEEFKQPVSSIPRPSIALNKETK